MVEVVLFHHARGLTDDVEAFAEDLRAAGHAVAVPDLYAGETFSDLDAGVAHAEELGFEELLSASAEAAARVPTATIYAGFSLGALCAHRLAQTRPDARAALLYHHGDVPMSTFGESWPAGVPVQIHVTEHDPYHDPDVTRDFVRRVGAAAELFVYPGSEHLFCDPAAPGYEPSSRALVLERTLRLLADLG